MKRTVLVAHLLPLLIPFTLFFLYSLLLTLAHSVGLGAVADYQGGAFTAYSRVLSDPLFRQSVVYSLWIAAASTAGALVSGSVLALMIWRLPEKLRAAAGLYRIPIILPHITVAFLVLFLFSTRGLIPALFYNMGVDSSTGLFSDFIYSKSGWAIIFAYTYKEAPFVVLMELSVLQTIPEDRIVTARQLGANGVRTYFSIVLPQLGAVLNTLFIILFLYSLGAFDIPFILGISNPSMLSIQIFTLYFQSDIVNRPLVMARLGLLFFFSLGFIIIYLRAAKKLDKQSRKI